MTKTYSSPSFDVDPTLPSNIFLLCKAALSGDQTAALLLADCVTEEWNGNGERLNNDYVRNLENELVAVREMFKDIEYDIPQHFDTLTIDRSDMAVFHSNFFKLQQQATALNRKVLSG